MQFQALYPGVSCESVITPGSEASLCNLKLANLSEWPIEKQSCFKYKIVVLDWRGTNGEQYCKIAKRVVNVNDVWEIWHAGIVVALAPLTHGTVVHYRNHRLQFHGVSGIWNGLVKYLRDTPVLSPNSPFQAVPKAQEFRTYVSTNPQFAKSSRVKKFNETNEFKLMVREAMLALVEHCTPAEFAALGVTQKLNIQAEIDPNTALFYMKQLAKRKIRRMKTVIRKAHNNTATATAVSPRRSKRIRRV